MPDRSPLAHYARVGAAVAVLAGLVYAQFSEHLPDALQIANPASLRQRNPACAIGQVPAGHTFLAASVLEGAVPTELLIGPYLRAANAVRISIDRGDTPITIFVSGYSTIFEFVGDVERVAKVVALSRLLGRNVGVVGIPSERVEFPARADCRFFEEASDADEAVRAKALAVMFGRRPDRAVYRHKAANLAFPDGRFDARAEQVSPAGTAAAAALDPARVVSALPVTRPEVLPGGAGLKQLEAAGIIRRPRADEVEQFIAGASLRFRSRLDPDYRMRIKFDYVITREAVLPSPLDMGRWGFLVLSGVPMPRNQHGACVARMDGFRLNDMLRCLGSEAKDAIERLDRLPAVDTFRNCRLLEPPQGAVIEAVAVYEPEAAAGRQSSHKPQPIDVKVDKEGDVVLVLSTYEPAIWRVSAGAGTRVAGVVLVGYHASRVEGLAPGTPVVSADHEGRAARPTPDPACARVQSWMGSAYHGGPDAIVLDRQVLALTGRNLDGWRGAHSLKDVLVR
jgi:hypothetical protein